MENLVIRKAGPPDVQAVIDLAVEMVQHSASPHRTARPEDVAKYRREDLSVLPEAILLEQNGVFVAELEGQMVGHVIVMTGHRDSSTGTPQAWVFDLSVHPSHWGRGIARRLMQAAEDFARQGGMRAIGLGVTLANARAVDFYHRIGYEDERLQMVKLLGEENDD